MPEVSAARKLCAHLRRVLLDLGLLHLEQPLAAKRISLARLRTGAVGIKELRLCGATEVEATSILLFTTSSRCGWLHAPSLAQSTLEWASLLCRYDVGMERYATELATNRLRAQYLALNLLTDGQLIAAGTTPEDAAKLRRCARIYQNAARRLALDLLAQERRRRRKSSTLPLAPPALASRGGGDCSDLESLGSRLEGREEERALWQGGREAFAGNGTREEAGVEREFIPTLPLDQPAGACNNGSARVVLWGKTCGVEAGESVQHEIAAPSCGDGTVSVCVDDLYGPLGADRPPQESTHLQMDIARMPYSESSEQHSTAFIPSSISSGQRRIASMPSSISSEQQGTTCMLSSATSEQQDKAGMPSSISSERGGTACIPSLISSEQQGTTCMPSSMSGDQQGGKFCHKCAGESARCGMATQQPFSVSKSQQEATQCSECGGDRGKGWILSQTLDSAFNTQQGEQKCKESGAESDRDDEGSCVASNVQERGKRRPSESGTEGGRGVLPSKGPCSMSNAQQRENQRSETRTGFGCGGGPVKGPFSISNAQPRGKHGLENTGGAAPGLQGVANRVRRPSHSMPQSRISAAQRQPPRHHPQAKISAPEQNGKISTPLQNRKSSTPAQNGKISALVQNDMISASAQTDKISSPAQTGSSSPSATTTIVPLQTKLRGPRNISPLKPPPLTGVPAQKAMGCVWKMVAERAQLVEEEGAAPDFNQSDLELHFARKPASYIMKRRAPGVARSLSHGPPRMTVLEGKRAYIFDIELSQFRLDFRDLAETVQQLDPHDELQIEQIERQVPSNPHGQCSVESSLRIAHFGRPPFRSLLNSILPQFYPVTSVEHLLKLVPTEAEVERVAQLEAELLGRSTPPADGPPSDALSSDVWKYLTRPEQFLLAFSRIARLC
ncbi:MAG: hypothetical protein SGPRY_012650, partial [Prymnesium sp.]